MPHRNAQRHFGAYTEETCVFLDVARLQTTRCFAGRKFLLTTTWGATALVGQQLERHQTRKAR